MLFKVDAFLMEKAQKLSDWFQDLTGYTNFTLARMCIYIFLILFLSSILVTGSNPASSFIVILMTTPMALFVISKDMAIINEAERKFFESNNNSDIYFKNELLLNSGGRIPSLIMLFVWPFICPLFLDGDILLTLGFMFLQMTKYFASCTPKPPQKSRIRKAIDKVKEKWATLTPRVALQKI